MEQIKVGDIVRVSADVPGFYVRHSFGLESIPKMEVKEVQDGCARICSLMSNDFMLAFEYIIPTKYLIKVNAEPEEPTIKVGDRVRIKPDVAKCLPSLLEPFKHLPFEVIAVGDGFITAECYGRYVYLPSPQFEFIQPKERTEKPLDGLSEEAASGLADAIKADAEMSEGTANELSDKIEAYIKALRKISDNYDWQRYEADLARETAVKIVNKHMDGRPEEVGAYVVKVAKEVVENLKK